MDATNQARYLLVFLLPLVLYACDGGGGVTLIAGKGLDNQNVGRGSQEEGALTGLGSTYGIALASGGRTAFVALGEDGVVRIDVTDPVAPKIDGYALAPGIVSEVDLSQDGHTVFVSGDISGVGIVDMEISSHNTIAYIATSDNSLIAANISDPTKPIQLSKNTGVRPSFIKHVLLSPDESILYLASEDAFSKNGGGGKLIVMDVSDPKVSRIIGSLETASELFHLAVSPAGSHIFAAAGDEGVLVIDVTAPAFPELVSSTSTQGAARDVLLATDDGVKIYVAHSKGIQVFDVGNVDTPRTLRSVDINGGAVALALSPNRRWAYVTGRGLTVIELSR